MSAGPWPRCRIVPGHVLSARGDPRYVHAAGLGQVTVGIVGVIRGGRGDADLRLRRWGVRLADPDDGNDPAIAMQLPAYVHDNNRNPKTGHAERISAIPPNSEPRPRDASADARAIGLGNDSCGPYRRSNHPVSHARAPPPELSGHIEASPGFRPSKLAGTNQQHPQVSEVDTGRYASYFA